MVLNVGFECLLLLFLFVFGCSERDGFSIIKYDLHTHTHTHTLLTIIVNKHIHT